MGTRREEREREQEQERERDSDREKGNKDRIKGSKRIMRSETALQKSLGIIWVRMKSVRIKRVRVRSCA